MDNLVNWPGDAEFWSQELKRTIEDTSANLSPEEKLKKIAYHLNDGLEDLKIIRKSRELHRIYYTVYHYEVPSKYSCISDKIDALVQNFENDSSNI